MSGKNFKSRAASLRVFCSFQKTLKFETKIQAWLKFEWKNPCLRMIWRFFFLSLNEKITARTKMDNLISLDNLNEIAEWILLSIPPFFQILKILPVNSQNGTKLFLHYFYHVTIMMMQSFNYFLEMSSWSVTCYFRHTTHIFQTLTNY